MTLRKLLNSSDKNGKSMTQYSWTAEAMYDNFAILKRKRTLIDDIVHIADNGDTLNISISNKHTAANEEIKKENFSWEHIQEMFAKAADEKFGHLIPHRYNAHRVSGSHFDGVDFKSRRFRGSTGLGIDPYSGNRLSMRLHFGDTYISFNANHPNITQETIDSRPIKDVISEITECLEDKLMELQEVLDRAGFEKE